MIEPQLENIKDRGEMKQSEHRSFKHQAMNADYYKNNMNMDRGHLFPCSYAPYNATKNSTFTLTNAVPQARSFNRRSWKRMECRVRKYIVENSTDNNNKIKAYVVTGAVPSNNNTLNNRVNIPDLMWTAYCCYNNNLKQWVAQAHWSKNVQDTKGKTLKPITLGALERKLKNFYNDKVNVFAKKCPRTVILSVLEDETGRNRERVEQDETGRNRERVEQDETGRNRERVEQGGTERVEQDETGRNRESRTG
ncbi:uncharacterized protein PFC0810c-like [Salmo salar]|uniref:Uncharacterized protein PFC0810c-like n=1 Tax=Salmo salar TaxID=8030 RepID=A0ABM3EDZ4_SALSA|nr:uncharacterized protein PFC0810c-like [Salmo salar]